MNVAHAEADVAHDRNDGDIPLRFLQMRELRQVAVQAADGERHGVPQSHSLVGADVEDGHHVGVNELRHQLHLALEPGDHVRS